MNLHSQSTHPALFLSSGTFLLTSLTENSPSFSLGWLVLLLCHYEGNIIWEHVFFLWLSFNSLLNAIHSSSSVEPYFAFSFGWFRLLFIPKKSFNNLTLVLFLTIATNDYCSTFKKLYVTRLEITNTYVPLRAM